ncbi:hypothetical protein [Nostoc sp. WHI]|uniref:hypothetical protein n=1 Tax=Nostoc sp. WHI TaxID=2650611 RepID=UPI0018C7473B|nr:hypothetical protein [Nostoc sp. WHI]MBG1270815.1 hypothetical protein [Nostoc sp. WHI]
MALDYKNPEDWGKSPLTDRALMLEQIKAETENKNKMQKSDYENVEKILLGAGFSPELVKASREASEKGSNRTSADQAKLDELKAEIIARLKR